MQRNMDLSNFYVGATSFSSGEGQCAAKRITKSLGAKGGP